MSARLRVQDLMKTNVISAHALEGLAQARDQMAEAGVRHLPVVDERGQLIGTLSQRDLSRALDLEAATAGKRSGLRVTDVMKRDVVLGYPQMPAYEAAALLLEHKIGALPIVDSDGRLAGIVSETDFLEVAREALQGLDPAQRAHA
jgi:CBS domain-containing protein